MFIINHDIAYETDCKKSKLNNNVLIIGGSGTGKTRNVIEPNLLNPEGSAIICDPKGYLYKKYNKYLQEKGIKTVLYDFVNPEESSHYNPFVYLHKDMDILRLAHILIGLDQGVRLEPFWDSMAEILISSLIAYMIKCLSPEQWTMDSLFTLLDLSHRKHNGSCQMDKLIEGLSLEDIDAYAVRQYSKIKDIPDRTYECILATIESKIGHFANKELLDMLSQNDFDFKLAANERTYIFVTVSDTDRSLDRLVSLFFSSALSELTRHADLDCGGALPVPVRFILDDFATNVEIEDFPKIISSVRSRNISIALAIQAENQLEAIYDKDAKTIVANCDTYLYLGGNDLANAKSVAERAGVPLSRILRMSPGTMYCFRRGEDPLKINTIQLDQYERDYSMQY